MNYTVKFLGGLCLLLNRFLFFLKGAAFILLMEVLQKCLQFLLSLFLSLSFRSESTLALGNDGFLGSGFPDNFYRPENIHLLDSEVIFFAFGHLNS